MSNYSEEDRRSDFYFFVDQYQDLYKKYGHKFIAIKDKQILGVFNDIVNGIETLSDQYEVGTYIIQECTGKESAYHSVITGLMIGY